MLLVGSVPLWTGTHLAGVEVDGEVRKAHVVGVLGPGHGRHQVDSALQAAGEVPAARIRRIGQHLLGPHTTGLGIVKEGFERRMVVLVCRKRPMNPIFSA